MSSMKSLIIAEKPSVANLIADALSINKKSKKAEFYERLLYYHICSRSCCRI